MQPSKIYSCFHILSRENNKVQYVVLTVLKELSSTFNEAQVALLPECRKGDSVKEIRDYWGDARIEEIHQRVSAWKSQSHPS